MYLCRLNPVTGLIDVEGDQDGFYAVPEFRALLSDEKLGRQKLTIVALVVDYESPIRNYRDNEKPLKAMDMVLNDRKLILWKSDEMQEAALAYKALQIDLDLEEKRMLDNMRYEKQIELDAAETTEEKIKLMKELSAIKAHIKEFNASTEGRDLYANSPVRNGYYLSRLEQKLENKKSFYHANIERKPIESDD